MITFHLIHICYIQALNEWVCISVDGIYVHRVAAIVTNRDPEARRALSIIDDEGMGRKTAVCAYARIYSGSLVTPATGDAECTWAKLVRANQSGVIIDTRIMPGKLRSERPQPSACVGLMAGGMLVVTPSASRWIAEMIRMGTDVLDCTRGADISRMRIGKSSAVVTSEETYARWVDN